MGSEQSSDKSNERPKFLAQVRQATIIDSLTRHGSVTVAELAHQFSVSDMTVRRDLVELEKDGKLARTHGGAVRLEAQIPAPSIDNLDQDEPAFEARMGKNSDLKKRIAEVAAGLAIDSRSVAIDVGTTTYLLAEMLVDSTRVKVFTNNIRGATLLAAKGIEVYLAGGLIREEEMSTSGANAVSQFEALWFDVAYVGVSGLTAQGIYDYSFDESDMKRLYLKRATRKVILCDSTKFDRMSLVHVAALNEFNTLVCDAPPPETIESALKAAGVEILVAS